MEMLNTHIADKLIQLSPNLYYYPVKNCLKAPIVVPEEDIHVGEHGPMQVRP